MSKQELVDKNEVLSIWHNYWESDKLAYEAEDELRELKTIICITELNENQQIVLDWLKVDYCKKDSLFEALERIGEVYEDPKTEEAFYSLSRVEEAEVIQMFIEWFIEQEGTE